MNGTPDPKTMAKNLRSELLHRKVEISHSASLEIVARQFGVNDWNILSAQLDAAKPTAVSQFEGACPILRIFDEEKAKEFYLEFLGFQLDWEHRFADNYPLYCQISRGNLIVHLSGHHGDSTPGSTVHVNMKGLKDFHSELTARDHKHAKPAIQKQPWGAEMKIADPFGNSFRFCER